jgi:hypothetical protein
MVKDIQLIQLLDVVNYDTLITVKDNKGFSLSGCVKDIIQSERIDLTRIVEEVKINETFLVINIE